MATPRTRKSSAVRVIAADPAIIAADGVEAAVKAAPAPAGLSGRLAAIGAARKAAAPAKPQRVTRYRLSLPAEAVAAMQSADWAIPYAGEPAQIFLREKVSKSASKYAGICDDIATLLKSGESLTLPELAEYIVSSVETNGKKHARPQYILQAVANRSGIKIKLEGVKVTLG